MKKVYIGIDAHKATNLLAYAFEGRERPELIGRVSTDLNRTLDAIRRFIKKHDLKKEQLRICYEAGPTGFVLARRLIKLGFDCIVVAPSKIPQQSGDKVKTDRRDARKLARFHRAGELTAVHIPDVEDEVIRDVCRARTDAVNAVTRAKKQLMGYLGLVSSEDSSGGKRRQGGITKCGNGHARWLLVECAGHYQTPPKISKALSKRQEGLDREIKKVAWHAQNRLNKRWTKLMFRGVHFNKIRVAIARELSSYIWDVAQTVG